MNHQKQQILAGYGYTMSGVAPAGEALTVRRIRIQGSATLRSNTDLNVDNYEDLIEAKLPTDWRVINLDFQTTSQPNPNGVSFNIVFEADVPAYNTNGYHLKTFMAALANYSTGFASDKATTATFSKIRLDANDGSQAVGAVAPEHEGGGIAGIGGNLMNYVQENPMIALGGAAAVAYVLFFSKGGKR